MRKCDINLRYRSCAIYCATKGRKNNGKARISNAELKERFGINWESLTNELRAKGMLFAGVDYVYLRATWAAMTAAEQMEEIKKMYPYPYEQ